MALEGFQPVVLRTFGGLCTSIDRLSLGVGMSPNVKNVKFDPGSVQTRPAYRKTNIYGAGGVSANSPIYAMASCTTQFGYRHLFYSTSYGGTEGKLIDQFNNVPTDVIGYLPVTRPVTIKGDSLYSVFYTALPFASPDYDGWGQTRLVGFRDTRTTPLALFEVAPGEPCWAVDTNPASPYHAEVTVAAGAGGLAVGVHMYTWLFLTDTGYITKPGKGGSFTVAADATSKLDIYNAPIGPPGTAARILALTAAGDSNFFWVPNKTIIWDNTTKDLSITVTEEDVYLGEPVRPYTTLNTPAAPAGVVAYSDRLVLWGSQEKSETSIFTYPAFTYFGLANLSFDGGFQTSTNQYYTSAANTLPSGWVSSAAGYAGFGPGATGTTLKITNPTLNHGCYVENVFDSTYIRSGQYLGLRFRARLSRQWTGASDGVIEIKLTLKNAGGATVDTTTTQVNYGTKTNFTLSSIVNASPVASLGVPPISSCTARIEVKCTTIFSNPADYVEIDWIEIYDASQSGETILRLSRPRDPQSFDYATGVISVGPDDGEGIKTCFKLRDSLYIAKDRSLYVTRDTGEEPYVWPVDLVDRVSGTPSIHGVAMGVGWAVIISRQGLVLFDGGTAQVISQEITPTWETIDFTAYVPPWVIVDTARKKIKIGACTSASTKYVNDLLLVLDYTEGFGNPVPTGQGRKWSIDTIDAKTGTFPSFHHAIQNAISSTGGTLPLYSMTGTPSTGSDLNIVTADNATVYSDFLYASSDGKILSVYETAPVGPEIGRATFDKVVQRTRGAETITVQFVKPDNSVISVGAGTAAMTATPEYDIELGSNTYATSLGIRLSTTVLNGWFALRRLAVFLKDSTYGFTRGKTDHTSA